MQTILDDLSPAPSFPTFSVRDLVLQGKLLLASSGKEFVKPAGILSSAAEVKKARKEAMGRLGLDFLDNVGDEMDLDKEFAEAEADGDVEMEDVPVKSEATLESVSPMQTCPPEDPIKQEDRPPTRSVTPSASSPAPSVPDDLGALSARERNRLKRKRKPGNSAFVAAPPPQATGAKYNAAPSGSSSKYDILTVCCNRIPHSDICRARLLSNEEKATPSSRVSSPKPGANGSSAEKVIIDPSKGGAVSPKTTQQSKALDVKAGDWVWNGVVSVLEVDLFSAAWEVRHGAAMALRELIKIQGNYGGMRGWTLFSACFIFLHLTRWCIMGRKSVRP
jgi:TATA-binding protein-associated factor